MAKVQFKGDYELVFPTLGLTVNKDDVFEAPSDVADGITIVLVDDKKSKTDSSTDTTSTQE